MYYSTFLNSLVCLVQFSRCPRIISVYEYFFYKRRQITFFLNLYLHLYFSPRFFSLQFTFNKYHWNTATSTCLYVVYACIHISAMDLTPCDGNYMTHTVYSLVLYKKSLLPLFRMSSSSFIWVPSL